MSLTPAYALLTIVTAIGIATWAAWECWRFVLLRAGCVDAKPARQYMHQQLCYQAVLLALALAVAVFSGALALQGTGPVFGIGMPDAPVNAGLFVLPEGWTWLPVGMVLTAGFGIATAIVAAASSAPSRWIGACKTYGWPIIAIAAANAFSEELIYRGAVVAVAQGRLDAEQTALLSALLFALAHIRGQASGVAVIAGSALIGGTLTYAVLQTHGLFWAWWLHFIQDVIIFTSLVAAQELTPSQKIASDMARNHG